MINNIKIILPILLLIIFLYKSQCISNKIENFEDYSKKIEKFDDDDDDDDDDDNDDDELTVLVRKKYDEIREIVSRFTEYSKETQNEGFKIGNLNIGSDINVKKSVNILPKGSIMAFSGSVLPEGWALCDGQNETPDLRGKFILGSGTGQIGTTQLTKRVWKQTGGSSTVTLTTANLPAHSHSTGGAGMHNHHVDNGRFCYWDGGWEEGVTTHGSHWDSTEEKSASGHIPVSTTGGHNHTLSNTGGGEPHDNMPPYYTLAYIMRLK